MLFNSFEFLVFLTVVLMVYYILPNKCRTYFLLVASYFFYMCWDAKYALLMLLSTVVTYVGGLLLGRKCISVRNKKITVAVILIVNLGILGLFKYLDFALSNLNKIFTIMGIEPWENSWNLLLPVGISFYTFQAIGYMIDVYRKETEPEKNFVRYALFVSFFPQLVAGPIERSKNLLSQIVSLEKKRMFTWDQIRSGALLISWGYFQKLIIAERAAVVVNDIYGNYAECGFVELFVGTTLFAIQIYCDFDGYTNIARGVARLLGFELIINFRQPYLARNISDFWKRWHISLTSWFTDYVYKPLGGSRKGKLRTLVNIGIVFLISGFWHGAAWHYIVWGGIHAVYQIIGRLWTAVGINRQKRQIPAIASVIGTFLLVDFAWIFFRVSSLSTAFKMIWQMMTCIIGEGFTFITLSGPDIYWLLYAIMILIVVDVCKEKQIPIQKYLFNAPILVRWLCYTLIFWGIILIGYYGPDYDASQFIYFQF